jgi:hypothetical protein
MAKVPAHEMAKVYSLFDISNLTADEIILRYETLLTEREK